MTQEQKDLLLKDLCARLPYGLILNCCEIVNEPLTLISHKGLVNNDYDIDEVKPYLFPLSSMTGEQKADCPIGETNLNIIISNIGCYGIIEIPWRLSFLFVDWCNKNHFDYRGLIPLNLANDATGKNIY